MSDISKTIRAYFVGAYGENDEFLEKIMTEFLRDHIFWRRNFHPKDKWRVPTSDQYSQEFLAAIANLKRELHDLSAELKNTTPFFSPRYIGHMASDLLLPGLLAQLITTLYNPNNIGQEAAPATVPLEKDVGEQLCRMVGYQTDNNQSVRGWGHLTSGGTVSNYEGLLLCRNIKLYSVALRRAARRMNKLSCYFGDKILGDYSEYELVNLSVDAIIENTKRLRSLVITESGEDSANQFFNEVEKLRVEHQGLGAFFQHECDRHHDEDNFRDLKLKVPVILAPRTIHYSIKKAMKLLGLGETNLGKIEVDSSYRMDTKHLRSCLDEHHHNRTPVLGVVAVLGTTEFGSVDPIDEIQKIRTQLRQDGNRDFYLHIDAAWGGYLSTLFRNEDGTWYQPASSRHPSEKTCKAFRSLCHADSITIDPHKLGYLPFGSGGIVLRNRETAFFLREEAPYVWEKKRETGKTETEQFNEELNSEPGKFVLEGSRPGANAAAIYVTHKLLPLHRYGFGQIVQRTVLATELFLARITGLKRSIEEKGVARICVPVKPQTNIVCYAVNPIINGSPNACPKCMENFTAQLFDNLVMVRKSAQSSRPLQAIKFLGTKTNISWNDMGEDLKTAIAKELGLDLQRINHRALIVLRHTLMNPWLVETVENKYYYLDLYAEYMEELIATTCAERKRVEGNNSATSEMLDELAWRCNDCAVKVS